MASEAVKKILEAEAVSDKKTAEARKQRDEIISSASGSSALSIQKRIAEATSETAKLRSEYDKKAADYFEKAESECSKTLDKIKSQSENKMDAAVNAIIDRYF